MASKSNVADPTKDQVFQTTALGCPAPRPERGYSFKIEHDKKNNDVVLYGSRRQVMIRNLKDPQKCELVGGHVSNVTVARIAPNGQWAASGDDGGKIRVWAYKRADHIQKMEKSTFAVRDIKWGGEGKRIVAGGRSGGNKVSCFSWDTGSEFGKMQMHNKPVNSVDIRQSRPFRVFSGAEDMKVNMYKGPPFKYAAKHKAKNFVNQLEISPDGATVCAVTASSEKLFFDAKTHELKKKIDDQKGMLIACGWNKDSKRVAVSSSNGKIHVTDVEASKTMATFQYDKEFQKHMIANACGFVGDSVFGVTLGGDIVRWGDDPCKPADVFTGHQSSVTSICNRGSTVFSFDRDGCAIAWEKPGVARRLRGTADEKDNRLWHNGSVLGCVCGDLLVTAGQDRTLRTVNVASGLDSAPSCEKLDGSPIAIAGTDKIAVLTLSNGKVVTTQKGAVTSSLDLEKTPTKGVLAISPDGSEIAVGVKGTAFHLYSVDGTSIKFKEEIDLRYLNCSALAYSPDGTMLAVGTKKGEVKVYKRDNMKRAWISGEWTYHQSAVQTIAWGASSKYVISSGLDGCLHLTFLDDHDAVVSCKRAHYEGTSGHCILSPNTVVSSGNDGSLKWHTIAAPEED